MNKLILAILSTIFIASCANNPNAPITGSVLSISNCDAFAGANPYYRVCDIKLDTEKEVILGRFYSNSIIGGDITIYCDREIKPEKCELQAD